MNYHDSIADILHDAKENGYIDTTSYDAPEAFEIMLNALEEAVKAESS